MGIRASVSVSSGSMWTNCDEVQHAVQPAHGTSDAFSPRIAPCISVTHDAKSPAAKSRPSLACSSVTGALRRQVKRCVRIVFESRRCARSSARRPGVADRFRRLTLPCAGDPSSSGLLDTVEESGQRGRSARRFRRRVVDELEVVEGDEGDPYRGRLTEREPGEVGSVVSAGQSKSRSASSHNCSASLARRFEDLREMR